MYLPPAAAWNVGHARWPWRFVAATGLLGLCLCLWLAVRQPWGMSSLILLALPGPCLLVAARGLRNSPTGQLRWDGTHWHWVGHGGSGTEACAVTRMACVIDLQWLMLLRVDCESAAVRWLWLESPHMDARWLALRRAVVAAPRSLQAQQNHSLPE
jgi:hypothetical protein